MSKTEYLIIGLIVVFLALIAFGTWGEIRQCKDAGGLYFSGGFGQRCVFPPLKQQL